MVSADVAVYPAGNARPTGGAGAIAMLLGANAPVVFDNIRSTFMDHAYDFYKPDPNSEYPIVDGHQSIDVYLNALRQCWSTLKQKHIKQTGKPPTFADYSYFAFHTPFSKMVQKAFFAFLLEDMRDNQHLYDSLVIHQLKEHEFKYSAKTVKILS